MSTSASLLAPLRCPGPAGQLAGWTSGSRDEGLLPILFIHPINLQGACWASVVGELAPLGRWCVLPDLRAHGGSDPAGPFGVEHWAEDLLAALDHLGIERAHVIGGSLGGALAVFLAATRPERVASVAAVGSSLLLGVPGLDEVAELFRSRGPRAVFEESLAETSLAPGASPEVVRRALELANPNDGQTVSEVWSASVGSDVRRYASDVRCPAAVISGEHDLTCPPEQAREMASALGVDPVLMKGVGHLPMLEAPAELARLLAAHLETAP
jgi:pimeloyl-ACP methyl ester carboxylesterase